MKRDLRALPFPPHIPELIHVFLMKPMLARFNKRSNLIAYFWPFFKVLLIF